MEIGDRVRVRVDGKPGRITRTEDILGEKRYLVVYDDAPTPVDSLPEGESPGPSAFIGQEHELEPI
jgi:hypothetical protein